MKRIAGTLMMISLLAAPVLGAAEIRMPSGVEQAEKVITQDLLEADVVFLSDDLLEGRAPGSEGDRLTQLYLSTRMKALGLEPGGADGSWLQPFDLVGVTSSAPETWTFRRSSDSVTLDWWEGYIAASGVQTEQASIQDRELVFVGYGIEAPEYQWDDFKDADLRGKVLLMLNNDPDWDPDLFEGNRRLYYGRWTYKYESAARQGAAGAIIIHTTPSAGYGWQLVQSSWTGEQFGLPAGDEARVPVQAWVTKASARELVEAAGKDLDELIEQAKRRDFQPVPLGLRSSLTLDNRISSVRTANVLGLLRGSDPALKDEVVVYTAHHDHLGMSEPNEEGDRIYNGARDNASGVAQILAVAEAFVALPERPRRSILFAFVAAEEQGLLGSRYYAANPTFPPGRIAANVNLDSANIFGRTRDVTFIGYGKSSLDSVVEAIAALQGRTVQGDQYPDRGYYYRSDQFNLAKIGVPAFYLKEGTDFRDRPEGWGREQIDTWVATHYHQPSDELDGTWNFGGMIEDARLAFQAGLVVASTDEMPHWNPEDEFEAARQQAIAALGAE